MGVATVASEKCGSVGNVGSSDTPTNNKKNMMTTTMPKRGKGKDGVMYTIQWMMHRIGMRMVWLQQWMT